MPPLSARIADLQASPIREILSVIERPGMISFAGGLPAPDSFPRLSVAEPPPRLLQYGASEGEPELRSLIAAQLAQLGLDSAAERVLVLSGSQQGIDLVAKLCIDPGTPVAVEAPTYLAALQAFRFFGARFLPLDPAQPELALAQRPALAYVIPTFQNPTGRCWTAAQRAALAASCDRHGVLLFEDDPYRDLVYEDVDRRPVCAGLRQASWVYQGSFSKTLAPGLRLGFLACSADLLPWLTRLKQAADLHSCRLSQWLVQTQLEEAGRATRLHALAARYRSRRDAFEALLRQHFSGLADWELPSGGLFFWLRLRQALDTGALLQRAVAQGVAFMPGAPFFPLPQEGASAHLRLNFSHASADQAERGLALLADLIRQGG